MWGLMPDNEDEKSFISYLRGNKDLPDEPSGYEFLSTCEPDALYSGVKENFPMYVFISAYTVYYLRMFFLAIAGNVPAMVDFTWRFLAIVAVSVAVFWMWREKVKGGLEVWFPVTIYRGDMSKTGNQLVVKSRIKRSMDFIDDLIEGLEKVIRPGEDEDVDET